MEMELLIALIPDVQRIELADKLICYVVYDRDSVNAVSVIFYFFHFLFPANFNAKLITNSENLLERN
jgi:hypothetical protein